MGSEARIVWTRLYLSVNTGRERVRVGEKRKKDDQHMQTECSMSKCPKEWRSAWAGQSILVFPCLSQEKQVHPSNQVKDHFSNVQLWRKTDHWAKMSCFSGWGLKDWLWSLCLAKSHYWVSIWGEKGRSENHTGLGGAGLYCQHLKEAARAVWVLGQFGLPSEF